MLTEALQELVREAGGDALLLDARQQRALVSDTATLTTVLKNLRNAGFARMIDFTAVHVQTERVGQASRLPSDEPTGETPVPPSERSGELTGETPVPPNENTKDTYNLLLTLRAPEHGHAALTLKWAWPPAPSADVEEAQADDAGYNDARGAGQSGGQPRQTGPVPHPTLSRIWPAAGLAEREIFDLLGLPFAGNENLAPLFLEEQFPGFPLRRDYQPPAREDFAGELLRERHETAMLDALVGEQGVAQASLLAEDDREHRGSRYPEEGSSAELDGGGGGEA